MKKEFNELGLSQQCLDAIEKLGYDNPTPVQEKAIPIILEGHDLIAAAKTGTGKTAAFALPSIDKLGHVKKGGGPLMLVLSPTRELANQIGDVCNAICSVSRHRYLSVVGGVRYDPQIRRIKNGVEILIATPGRLVDLMQKNAVDLSHVGVLVLDEADRMLDMGFWPQMKQIIEACPSKRQTLLFSATIDEKITNNTAGIMKDPKYLEIAKRGQVADTIKQYIIPATQHTKADTAIAILEEKGCQKVIIFARTKHRADTCVKKLRGAGFFAEAIHSDKSQNQRSRALANFASGRTDILVATDVLARGIDVSDVNYVINYDLPNQSEDYVHRIGRCGRAGNSGFAISLVSSEQRTWLRDIEKLIGMKIPTTKLENFDTEEAESRAALRIASANRGKDPELAQAAKQHANNLRRKERQNSDKDTPRKGGHSNKSRRKGAGHTKHNSGSNNRCTQDPKKGSKSNNQAKASTRKSQGQDFRPGRSSRAARATKR